MMRGVRRGCVRLKSAILGIDNEEDGNFTITTDSKTFHFQARDSAEREVWVRALEDTILRHAPFHHDHPVQPIVVLRKHMPHHLLKVHFEGDEANYEANMKKFDSRIAQADVLLQILIEQTQILEEKISTVNDDLLKSRLERISRNFNLMVGAVKLAIVLLQILKTKYVKEYPSMDQSSPCRTRRFGLLQMLALQGLAKSQNPHRMPRAADRFEFWREKCKTAFSSLSSSGAEQNTIDPANGIGLVTSQHKSKKAPRTSGSQFYTRKPSEEQPTAPQTRQDCGDAQQTTPDVRPTEVELASDCLESRRLLPAVIENLSDVTSSKAMTLIVPAEVVPETSYSSSDDDEDFFDADDELHSPVQLRPTAALIALSSGNAGGSNAIQKSEEPSTSRRNLRGSQSQAPPILNDGSLDYDALYEEDSDQSDISMENHGSMITHLLSQVKIGMDLTKVVLPTFILETRSLLEMYADYFAHPDIFVGIVDKKTPKERMVQVVKWYMSAYHAGRKSAVAKKPYNPILGEVFQCHWDVPGLPETDFTGVSDGPVPWCSRNQLTFIAEQVSHHPPVSAFYAECVAKRICFEAFVYTKSKFLGLSVGVHNIGHGTVYVLDENEQYVVTFPSGYGRSILTTPWIELGGTVSITSNTGYSASVEFHTKPFYGGKKHKITAEIFAPAEKKPFMLVTGEWNGTMEAKWTDTGKNEVFVDVLKMPVTKKNVRKINEQADNESRRLWKEVTAGLRLNDIEKATTAKTTLEQKQREEAKKRKERGTRWETKMFYEKTEGDWCYKKPLTKRSGQEGRQEEQDHGGREE